MLLVLYKYDRNGQNWLVSKTLLMNVTVFRAAKVVVVGAGDCASFAATMPFGTLPVNVMQVNIVSNVFVTLVVQQFVAPRR